MGLPGTSVGFMWGRAFGAHVVSVSDDGSWFATPAIGWLCAVVICEIGVAVAGDTVLGQTGVVIERSMWMVSGVKATSLALGLGGNGRGASSGGMRVGATLSGDTGWAGPGVVAGGSTRSGDTGGSTTGVGGSGSSGVTLPVNMVVNWRNAWK